MMALVEETEVEERYIKMKDVFQELAVSVRVGVQEDFPSDGASPHLITLVAAAVVGGGGGEVLLTDIVNRQN